MVGDIAGLADNTGSLSVITNEKGGIIDDTVVTKASAGRCLPVAAALTMHSLLLTRRFLRR